MSCFNQLQSINPIPEKFDEERQQEDHENQNEGPAKSSNARLARIVDIRWVTAAAAAVSIFKRFDLEIFE
jgi:hypothetical protein